MNIADIISVMKAIMFFRLKERIGHKVCLFAWHSFRVLEIHHSLAKEVVNFIDIRIESDAQNYSDNAVIQLPPIPGLDQV